MVIACSNNKKKNDGNVCVWLIEKKCADGGGIAGREKVGEELTCSFFLFQNHVMILSSLTLLYTSIFLPKTFNFAVKLYWPASFEMEHVHSPLCAEDKEGMLRRELYWSRDVTFAPKMEGNGSPSLSQRNVSGGSPFETPQTVRVRIPSARPSWKENGSIIGGTGNKKWTHEIEEWKKNNNNSNNNSISNNRKNSTLSDECGRRKRVAENTQNDYEFWWLDREPKHHHYWHSCIIVIILIQRLAQTKQNS